MRARDEQDALRVANHAGYGRSGTVFTADVERGVRFALGLDAGLAHVNESPVNDDAITGLSLRRAIDEFTTECRVSVPAARPDSPVLAGPP